MSANITVGVTSLLPWFKEDRKGERTEIPVQPGQTTVKDLLSSVGIADQSWQNFVLVVIDGKAAPLNKVLSGGEEIQLVAAISGG